jgi:hypothetical protein
MWEMCVNVESEALIPPASKPCTLSAGVDCPSDTPSPQITSRSDTVCASNKHTSTKQGGTGACGSGEARDPAAMADEGMAMRPHTPHARHACVRLVSI